MTLIASHITKFGIVLASDSNLTDDRGNAGFGQKIFSIPHLNAALAYSGSYSVNYKNLDIWLNEFIGATFYTCKTIKEFCDELAGQLAREMQEEELKERTIVHVAGYTTYKDKSYPEHWHVSNTGLDPTDGSYSPAQNTFHVNCDFSPLHIGHHKTFVKTMEDNPREHAWYINGFPPGRISMVHVKYTLEEALHKIWNNPNWKFHEPKSLFDFANIVKLYFDFVIRLFPMSEYSALYIGGDIQTYLISVPQNIDKD